MSILKLITSVNLRVVDIIQTNMSIKHSNADQVNEVPSQTHMLKSTKSETEDTIDHD